MTVESGEDGASQSQTPSPDDSSGDRQSAEMAEQPDKSRTSSQSRSGNGQSKAANAKDPLRPRRKKARRACFACQRAHLTCGDERPCQRCIKRNLQDACHDGVRKKAKYLHDAPSEALMPGLGARSAGSNHFQYLQNLGRGQHLQSTPAYPGHLTYASQPSSASNFPGFASTSPQIQMPPPLSDGLMNSQAYSSQQSPISPHFNSGSNTQSSPMQSLGNTLRQSQQATPTLQTSFGGLPYDTSDPNQYNFDPATFNFGNHYGALEFGMLGHMSSGAAETPPSDASGLLNQGNNTSYTTPGTISTSYSGSPGTAHGYHYPQEQTLGEWRGDVQSNPRHANATNPYGLGQGQDPAESMKQEAPPAFSIGAVPSAFDSPATSSSSQGITAGFDESSSANNSYVSNIGRQAMHDRSAQKRHTQTTMSGSTQQASALPARRARDSSSIYDSVKQPYSYTSGFHGLTTFLQKRFSPQRTLRIAKALASIRPSFISCTKTLNREDLIFMEKCFQRTLWEYEEFINACGTPTIVCRRTGEVAAVGKEFTILTGWSKEVLLGKVPNLNINTGGTSGQPGTGASSRGGFNTPRVPDEPRQQPVFLAELLDDDSAIEFYEDFARLAFGDSRGSVTTQCKLLKYRTINDPSFTAEGDSAFDNEVESRLKKQRHFAGKGPAGGEAKITDLGEKDGKVECSYCWTVKRDVFDIPMLIVMNFLPCI
ncbi:riboflavin kinase [Physcia stellaris]|nr:riboflavin kinase [Physcia stellaris]